MSYAPQLRLDRRPADAVGALLQALLGRDPALAPLAAMLRDRTAGNPLFLEESVRALVETGALHGTPGDYRLVRLLPAGGEAAPPLTRAAGPRRRVLPPAQT